MTASDKEFTGSIPELYDRLLVPLIFEPYAVDLAARIAAAHPQTVLETAAGSGALTRAMAARLPADARIAVTDLNQPMLDQARKRLADDSRFTWRQADALTLPFDNGSFDVVACQFGAMFFPDRIRGYGEARRVLKPGGRFLFNVWDRIETNEFAETVTEALRALFPADPPLFLARTPHGYYDSERIRADLIGAGFRTIGIQEVEHRSEAASPLDPAVAYCQGTPLRAEIESRAPPGIIAATQAAADALALRYGSRPITGRIRALVVSAAP